MYSFYYSIIFTRALITLIEIVWYMLMMVSREGKETDRKREKDRKKDRKREALIDPWSRAIETVFRRLGELELEKKYASVAPWRSDEIRLTEREREKRKTRRESKQDQPYWENYTGRGHATSTISDGRVLLSLRAFTFISLITPWRKSPGANTLLY